MKISYQGIEGSFSHRTAMRHFGANCEYIGLPTFEEAFRAVEGGRADLALLPIENTLAGTIFETLDLLNQGALQIIGETDTRIEHSLLVLPGAKNIKKVLSHPKALAQCTRFFQEHPEIQAVPHYDTAGAALDVAKMKDPSCAAIANCAAAEIYGLEVLSQGIEDHPENYTRFLLLARQGTEGKKCTLHFTLEHCPGSLGKVLTVIGRFGNLTQIVSRPLIGHPYEYGFFVDFVGPTPLLLEELKKMTKTMKILGRYDGL